MEAAIHPGVLAQALPAPCTPPVCVRVLLVAPFAPNGGGMGRMMAYLADEDRSGGDVPPAGRYSYELIESRGSGPALMSIFPMLRAAWIIWRRARGPSPVLLHINMAERGSVLRKGVLVHLGRALGVPTILHLHAAEIMDFYEGLGAPRPGARARGFPCGRHHTRAR